MKVVTQTEAPTVDITANPASIASGNSSTLTVTATNATQVTVTGTDQTTFLTCRPTGGTQTVSPAATATYTAVAIGAECTGFGHYDCNGERRQDAFKSINHVIFMLQENHSFDNYFGMLNPYRKANGWNIGDDGKDYEVDGIDDKLTTISNVDDEGDIFPLFKFSSTCIDDETSAWLESYGDVNRYDFLPTRPILMDGFVHTAEGFAKSCAASGTCSGNFTDLSGRRAMGYYDQDFLNYYYYMASQFALSDRWFSPVSSKSIANRIATFTGGTTQGLVKDPGNDDHLPQLEYTIHLPGTRPGERLVEDLLHRYRGFCLAGDDCSDFGERATIPATTFTYSSLLISISYTKTRPALPCTGTTQPSSVVGDASNSSASTRTTLPRCLTSSPISQRHASQFCLH